MSDSSDSHAAVVPPPGRRVASHSMDRPFFIAFGACLAVLPAGRVTAETHLRATKLIEYGVDYPSIKYTRLHVRRMEQAPFDGVVLRWTAGPEGKTRDVSHTFFTGERIPESAVDTAIADLKATTFNRFTDNFLNVRVIPGHADDHPDHNGDWFDDTLWRSILHNAGAAATVARNGGLKGILFDPEAYHGNPWHYRDQKHRAERTFEEYVAKVRQRGRQFIRAMNAAYPDITLIAIFSTSAALAAHEIRSGGRASLEESGGLLPAFMDGIIEASTPQTTLIDGYETAYPFTEYRQFADARDLMAEGAAALSEIPELYRKKMKVGFGLSTGHVTPEELRHTLRYASRFAHRYIWIWSAHNTNWWEGRFTKEYEDVLSADRTPVTDDEIARIEEELAESRELRSRIRPPVVGVIYSALHPSSDSVTDEVLEKLAWRARKWENVDLDGLMQELAAYDLIIFQQNFNLANTRDLRKYRDRWLAFLERGGIVLAMEVQGNPKPADPGPLWEMRRFIGLTQQSDWIADLGPRFRLTVRSFRGFQHGSSWRNADSELDFGFVKATWAHFETWAPQWVVANRNAHDKPIILHQRVGRGLLLASTTYLPYFPQAKHLETIWYRWRWRDGVEGA